MAATVGANGMTVVHATSGGVLVTTPDVCKIPVPPVFVPFPNIALSLHTVAGTKTVFCDGNSTCIRSSMFLRSSGDEPGVLGGVLSKVNMAMAEFVGFSFDVMMEGQNVPRALDLMVSNRKNTAPMPLTQAPLPPTPGL